MNSLIFILFIALSVQASDPFELSSDEINPETQEILIKKPEKHLRHESMIYNLNTDLGIKDQRHYTGNDSNKIGLAGHLSGDYEHFTDLYGFEFNYLSRSNRYHRMWYGFQVFQHRANFASVTQNQDAATGDNTNDESQFRRPNNAKNTITAVGPGLSHRFKLLMEFMPTEDVFESVDVYVNYLLFNESFIKKQYRGYGLTTSYGIHKRSSAGFFYGGKFSYNLASVTRDALGDESKSDRSLSLGWLSLGFEFGLFF